MMMLMIVKHFLAKSSELHVMKSYYNCDGHAIVMMLIHVVFMIAKKDSDNTHSLVV